MSFAGLSGSGQSSEGEDCQSDAEKSDEGETYPSPATSAPLFSPFVQKAELIADV